MFNPVFFPLGTNWHAEMSKAGQLEVIPIQNHHKGLRTTLWLESQILYFAFLFSIRTQTSD